MIVHNTLTHFRPRHHADISEFLCNLAARAGVNGWQCFQYTTWPAVGYAGHDAVLTILQALDSSIILGIM